MMSFHRKMLRGFTMIELLVVMGIILLLMAILFPAISGAKKSAMISKAQSDIKMLHTAIQSFRNEYDRYPLHRSKSNNDLDYTPSGDDNSDLIATLLGSDDTDNPRQISFLKINAASLDDNSFVDPWDSPYYAKADTTFDGEINLNPKIYKGGVDIASVTNAAIAVWSLGDPDEDDVGPFTSWGGEFVEKENK